MKQTVNRMLPRIYGALQRLNEQRYLYSIRTAFISTMPVMIVGAFAVAVNQLPLPAYQQTMLNWLGPRWTLLGELVYSATMQIVTLMVVFATCRNLAGWYNQHKKRRLHEMVCGMVGLSCYVIVSLDPGAQTALPFALTGVSGLFVAMVVAVVATELFVRFSPVRGSALMGDDPNPAVPRSFAAVRPAAVVIVLFALARMVLVYSGVSSGLGEIVYYWLSRPYIGQHNSIATAQLFNVSSHSMWVFGIHGNNVLEEVAQNVFVPAMAQNVQAAAAGLAPPNLVTKTLFDVFVYMGGAGTTLALLAALMIFGKRRNYRMLFRYALPTSLFNINEPLIFGLPIVLNPVFIIPFILTPVLMLSFSMLAMWLGLVPFTCAEVSWTTPVFFSGYLATGSIAGSLLQLFNLAVGVLVYAPFVRLNERLMQLRFDTAYKQLVALATSDYSREEPFISRGDTVGTVARRIANQLDSAVQSGEMYLNYQPIVDSRQRTVHGVEALLRWRHPQYGLINPMLTIALAEETGYINKLGLWIFEQAVMQRGFWNIEGLPPFHISVNVSAQQLDDEQFSAKVQAMLRRHNVAPAQIQVEITETAALLDDEKTHQNLHRLHDFGMGIAMDDFGVGHSSLLYLRTQPITALKIDGSLSRDVVAHPANLDIIATIFDLCNLLGIATVVEYVDNKQQLQLLQGIGTFLIQGYYYSKPLPAEEVLGFLRNLADEKINPPEG